MERDEATRGRNGIHGHILNIYNLVVKLSWCIEPRSAFCRSPYACLGLLAS
jgi:hypothetical protein